MEAVALTPVVTGLNLGERLGQGTYATVYKAFNRIIRTDGTREVYAVKCILKSKICVTQTSQDNIISEIKILKALRHRHIVHLDDFQWDKNYIYIILEYCNAGDLSQFLQKQQRSCLPEPFTRKFLQQLASAMRYLRMKQISHMDLKPQNILLTTDKRRLTLKLGDFGFARVMGSGDYASSYRGSPLYMAPEILTRQIYDARVDLWSIGVILYQCLFGRAPFASPTMEELVTRIVSDEPIEIPTNPAVSDCCKSFLLGLLQRDPNKRIQFDEFFTHPFVDLDHAPSEECLKKATDYLDLATKADDDEQYYDAVKLYCRALDYFLPALQYFQQDSTEHSSLRSDIKKILRRGEELKRLIKQPNRSFDVQASTLSDTLRDVDLLKRLWSDVPQVEAVLVLINFAENLEIENKYEESLDKYHLAIESSFQILSKEPKKSSERGDILKRFVNKWLSKAERIQIYIDAKKLNASVVEAKECDALAVEEKTKSMLQDNMCKLQ